MSVIIVSADYFGKAINKVQREDKICCNDRRNVGYQWRKIIKEDSL